MPFIGNQPALSYTSFAKQDFTTSATTSYTLDNPVANENEIALFINFVRQEPTTAYTASGTNLNLTSATSASDDMYCVFLGKAVQTVNPPNGSVGTAQIADLAVTSGKLASGVLPDNTPAFEATLSAEQSASDDVFTKMDFDEESFDTDGAYDHSTNQRFTVPSGKAGKYHIYANVTLGTSQNTDLVDAKVLIYKNGSVFKRTIMNNETNYTRYTQLSVASTMVLSVGDYVEIYAQVNRASGNVEFRAQNGESTFGGFKIIE